MSREFLGDRERGLENEFFHRVDQKLWRELRDRREAEGRVEVLRTATGIEDAAVLRELVELGIGEDSLMALTVYPLVRVAWADGSIDARERDAVLRAAGEVGCGTGTPGGHLLGVWLDQQPDENVHRAWRDYVHALNSASSPEVRESMRDGLLARARKVAEAAGGFLGLKKVSDAVEAVLSELARVFDEPG